MNQRPRTIQEQLTRLKEKGMEFNDEQIEYLLKLTKDRKYFRSGGSDYHGKNKVGINLGEGKGNLQIPEEFVENWK